MKYVAIEGNVGAGKSTFVRRLRETVSNTGKDVMVFEEPLQTWGPFLKDFYDEPSKATAMALQLEIMRSRVRQMRDVRKVRDMGNVSDRELPKSTGQAADTSISRMHPPVFFERSIESGRHVFVPCMRNSGLIDDDDVEEYDRLSAKEKEISRAIHDDDKDEDEDRLIGVVYLDVPPEVCYERCVGRSRASEESVTLSYLRQLDAAYKKWISDLRASQSLEVLVVGDEPDASWERAITEVIGRFQL